MTTPKQYPKWLVDAFENSDPLPPGSFFITASSIEDLVDQLKELEPAFRIIGHVSSNDARAAVAAKGAEWTSQMEAAAQANDRFMSRFHNQTKEG